MRPRVYARIGHGLQLGKIGKHMKRKSQSTINAVEFIDRVIRLDEKGEPFSLSPYQRRALEMALRRDPSASRCSGWLY